MFIPLGSTSSLTVCDRFEDQQLSQPVGARPLSKRQVAYLSPRLGILNNIPFAIPFDVRVAIFRQFIDNDERNLGHGPDMFLYATEATVRRGHIAEDGFDKLGEANLKGRIKITFIDQFGEVE